MEKRLNAWLQVVQNLENKSEIQNKGCVFTFFWSLFMGVLNPGKGGSKPLLLLGSGKLSPDCSGYEPIARDSSCSFCLRASFMMRYGLVDRCSR